MNKKIKHKVGDKIYIESAYHISRGEDDREGGLVTIKSIDIDKKLGQDHFNGVFITVEGFPHNSFNYWHLLDMQKELKKEFWNKKAKSTPYINTPWIQKGDTVNGEVYDGDDIW